MTTSTGERNHALDWMRAISILYIVGFWHLFDYSDAFPSYHHPLFRRIAVLALAVFTLISGYLMGRAPPPASRREAIDFYRRRLIRIYPPYLAAILLFFAMRITSRLALLKGIVVIGMVVPPPPHTLWFVGMIILFYLATPLFLRWTADRRAGIARFAAVTLGMWAIHAATGLIDARMPIYFPSYAAGLLLARHRPGRITTSGWAALLGLTAIAAIVSLRAVEPLDTAPWLAPFALLSSLTLFLAVDGRLPANRGIAWLSYGSFFLYLVHRPVFAAIVSVAGAVDHRTLITLLLMIGLPLAILLGWIGQTLYDRTVVPRLNRGERRAHPG